MTPHRLLALALALGAAGCVNVAAELGEPPPVALSVARRDLVVALRRDPQVEPGARARLRQAITALGGTPPLAVRARVEAATAGDAEAVRRALLGLGVDPARIIVQPAAFVPRLLPRVMLTRTFAAVAECGAAITPSFHNDVAPSLDSLGRCIQQNNLAAMVVDPADLVDPPPLAAGDAAFLVGGLNARLSHQNVGLPAAGLQADSAGASGGGSYGGVAPVGDTAVAPLSALPAIPAAPVPAAPAPAAR